MATSSKRPDPQAVLRPAVDTSGADFGHRAASIAWLVAGGIAAVNTLSAVLMLLSF